MVAQGKNTGYNNYEYKCEKKEKMKQRQRREDRT